MTQNATTITNETEIEDPMLPSDSDLVGLPCAATTNEGTRPASRIVLTSDELDLLNSYHDEEAKRYALLVDQREPVTWEQVERGRFSQSRQHIFEAMDLAGGYQNFVPARCELGLIAKDYLQRVYEYSFKVHLGDGLMPLGWPFIEYAAMRLEAIEGVLGKEVLGEILAPINEKWRALFEAAKECGLWSTFLTDFWLSRFASAPGNSESDEVEDLTELSSQREDVNMTKNMVNPQSQAAEEMDKLLSLEEAKLEFIDDFRVTGEDLEVLAEHYLAECWNETYSMRFYPAGCFDRNYMLDQRLRAIREALGDHAFEEIQERVDRKWRRIFKDAERALVCKACGVSQKTLWRFEDGMCVECRGVKRPRAERGEGAHSTLRSPGS